MTHFIDFEPLGRRGECPEQSTLMDCARHLGVELASVCGGQGSCGCCVVQVIGGEVSAPAAEEAEFLSPDEVAQGYRLACRTSPLGDCKIQVPLDSLTSTQRIQVEGLELPVAPDPLVRALPVSLRPATLDDPRADAERLIQALERQHGLTGLTIDLQVLRGISPWLRQHMDWRSPEGEIQAAVREGEVIALLPAQRDPLGLAVDLGTTKVAAYLLDLVSGRTLASHGSMNPQIAYGEDVIARIAFAEKGESNAGLMSKLVAKSLNEAVAELCAAAEAEPWQIVDAVIVGNTAMHHLFLGLPVRQLARSPYVPAVAAALDLKARDLGLHLAPGCWVHAPASIAGFVGGDHVAMLLAAEIAEHPGVALAIDIGTNTEICLSNRGSLISTSCASGPAFEGAHIKHGMRAADGAIERLRLSEGRLEYQTIGGAPPVGLCGSGILDAMAQLLIGGVIDQRGGMRRHPGVRQVDDRSEFVLIDERDLPVGPEARRPRQAITLSQKDVRQIQLAKAAIWTGIEMLLEAQGLRPEDIQQVTVAGAFGSYIDISSAIEIGMLPELPLNRFHQVGNAAGMGAKLMLLSHAQRAAGRALAERVGYLELAAHPRFTAAFTRAMTLGRHTSLRDRPG